MEAHHNRLIESEVLLVREMGAGGRAVTLNPALLEETQNLINRTVTPFWESLIAD
jgi:hypothetical protein